MKKKHLTQNLDSAIYEWLNDNSKRKAALLQFKEYFNQIIHELNKKNKQQDNVLIIFIDELDRCKPSFSLALFEIIKHMFDIKKTCFVLAMNTKSIAKSVAKVYGYTHEEAIGYLERVIDIPIHLPEPDKEQFINYEIKKLIEYDQIFNNLKELIKAISFTFDFSLRDIGKYLRELQIFLTCNQFDKQKAIPDIYLPVVSYLLALKRKVPGAYKNFLESFEQKYLHDNGLWPIALLTEENKEWLAWSLKFLGSSKNKKHLSTVAHELNSTIKSYYSRGLSDEEQELFSRLKEISNQLINKIYGDFSMDRADVFIDSNGNKWSYLKNYINHYEIIKSSIEWMDYMLQDNLKT